MTRAYLMAGSGTVAPRRPARSLAVGLGGQSAGAGGLPCSRTGDGPPPAALGSSAGFRGATLFRCGLAPPLQLSLAWSPRDLATVFRHLGATSGPSLGYSGVACCLSDVAQETDSLFYCSCSTNRRSFVIVPRAF